MAHPFRHELDAAHARIEQLENQLSDARRRGTITLRPGAHRLRKAAPVMMMLGCVFVGVGFSLSAVSRISDTGPVRTDIPVANAAFLRAPMVTVAPEGLSAWQIGNVASRYAMDLNAACGSVLEPTSVNLEVDVDPEGHVEHAVAHGPELLARCTEKQARFWQFPKSDGMTHSSVPLYFRPSFASGAPIVDIPSAAPLAQSGAIAVTCAPQCDTVLVDGAPIGRGPILSHPTSPGRHTLELISGTRKRTILATVNEGRTTDVREDLTDLNSDAPP